MRDRRSVTFQTAVKRLVKRRVPFVVHTGAIGRVIEIPGLIEIWYRGEQFACSRTPRELDAPMPVFDPESEYEELAHAHTA